MKLHVYRDTAGEYRWRIRARNGRILADSGEGYKRRSTCLRVARMITAGPIDIIEEST